MEITVWSFFTMLIGQAACFPNFEFESLAKGGVSDNFLEDLKKLMSNEGLTKDSEDVQHLLNGLANKDFNHEPDVHRFKLPKLSSFFHPTQQPSSTISDLTNADQNLSEFNQSESPPAEVKSLAEWIQIDRMGGSTASEKTASIESTAPETPAQPADDTEKLRPLNLRPMESTAQESANFVAEVASPMENASLGSDLSLDNVQTGQAEIVPPTVVENHPVESDPFRRMFRFKLPNSSEEVSKQSQASQQDASFNTGDHASNDVKSYESAVWMKPSSTDPEVKQPVQDDDDDDDDDDGDDDDTSIADRFLKRISSWGQYLFGSS